MDNELAKIIGRELRILRYEKGLTNKELSKKTGIADSTISRYENGSNNMKLDNIEKIIECCDSNSYIFFTKCIAKLQR